MLDLIWFSLAAFLDVVPSVRGRLAMVTFHTFFQVWTQEGQQSSRVSFPWSHTAPPAPRRVHHDIAHHSPPLTLTLSSSVGS